MPKKFPKDATEGTYSSVHQGSILGQCDATLIPDSAISSGTFRHIGKHLISPDIDKIKTLSWNACPPLSFLHSVRSVRSSSERVMHDGECFTVFKLVSLVISLI